MLNVTIETTETVPAALLSMALRPTVKVGSGLKTLLAESRRVMYWPEDPRPGYTGRLLGGNAWTLSETDAPAEDFEALCKAAIKIGGAGCEDGTVPFEAHRDEVTPSKWTVTIGPSPLSSRVATVFGGLDACARPIRLDADECKVRVEGATVRNVSIPSKQTGKRWSKARTVKVPVPAAGQVTVTVNGEAHTFNLSILAPLLGAGYEVYTGTADKPIAAVKRNGQTVGLLAPMRCQ